MGSFTLSTNLIFKLCLIKYENLHYFSFVEIFSPLAIIKDWKFYVVIKLYMPKVNFSKEHFCKPLAKYTTLSTFPPSSSSTLTFAPSVLIHFFLKNFSSPFTGKHWKSLKKRMFFQAYFSIKELRCTETFWDLSQGSQMQVSLPSPGHPILMCRFFCGCHHWEWEWKVYYN